MGIIHASQDSSMSQLLIDYYVSKAKGGSDFITVEAASVAPFGKAIVNQLALWSDEHVAGCKKLVDECHKYGAKVSARLHYADSETNPFPTAVQPVFSAPIPCRKYWENPNNLTTEEVYEMIQKLVDAARRCWDAGVDVVEVHATHDDLVGQFLSPRINKRVDEFGGNLENRLRFLLLIIQGIRQQIDQAYPIIVRTVDVSVIELRAITRRLEEAGVNAILVSAKLGYLAYLADKIKKSAKIPVMIKFLLVPLADTLNLMSQRISFRLARRI